MVVKLISEPGVKPTTGGGVNAGLGSHFDRVCHCECLRDPYKHTAGQGHLGK